MKHIITDANNFRSAYNAYFGVPVGDQDKSWAHHVVCGCCRSTVEAWYRGDRRRMNFGLSRIWWEPTDHVNNCSFCVVDVTHLRKGKKTYVFGYPDIPSSLRPVAHCEEIPVPSPPQRHQCYNNSCGSGNDSIEDEDVYEDVATHHFPNNLKRDLGLTKSNAELLTSRLKEWNLLDKSCLISGLRKCHIAFTLLVSVLHPQRTAELVP